MEVRCHESRGGDARVRKSMREIRVSMAECQTSVCRACIQRARAHAMTADAFEDASEAARESEI